MRRIYIWGAGGMGQTVAKEFPLLEDESFVAYVDNNSSLQRDYQVIAPQEFARRFHRDKDVLIIAVENFYFMGDIFFQLHDMGFSGKVLVIKPHDWNKRNKLNSVRGKCFWDGDIDAKAVITKLEFHVCDQCNLNCAGCTHFAPIYKDSFASLEDFAADMERLSKDFFILRLRLMGGEPFLNHALPDFIETARRHFPHSHLEIVTNGLLLPKMNAACLESIRKNEAFVQISLYPPTFAMRNEISRTLESYGIEYSFGSGLVQANEEGIIREFHQCFTGVKGSTGREAATRCLGSSCHYLRHGKISKCALPLLAHDVNAYFGKNLEVSQEDYVDIYDDSTGPWEKVRKLRQAIPFCDYCGDGTSTRFDWKCGGEVLFSDYLK